MDDKITLDPEAATRPQLRELLVRFTGMRYPETIPDAGTRKAYRGARSAYALIPYTEHMGGPDAEPLEQQIRDLLTDLMHLCDLFPDDTSFDFGALLEAAAVMYQDEESEQL